MDVIYKIIYISFFLLLNYFLTIKLFLWKGIKMIYHLILLMSLLFLTKFFYDYLQNNLFYVSKEKFLLLVFFSFSIALLNTLKKVDINFIDKINLISKSNLVSTKINNSYNLMLIILITIFQIILILNKQLFADT